MMVVPYFSCNFDVLPESFLLLQIMGYLTKVTYILIDYIYKSLPNPRNIP